MIAPPLPDLYEDAIPTLNDAIRRATDSTLSPISYLGVVVNDIGGTGFQCRIGALYDSGTQNWIVTTTNISPGSQAVDGLIVSDVAGTSHTGKIGALYDSSTGNWIVVVTPVS